MRQSFRNPDEPSTCHAARRRHRWPAPTRLTHGQSDGGTRASSDRWTGFGERGSATVELALLSVPLAALASLIAVLGRLGVATGQVNTAARDAARAASLTRTPAAARQAALAAARATLTDQRLTCTQLQVTTDLRDWRPGGLVAVTVTCTTSLHRLGLAAAPGTVRVAATGAAPLDRNRTVTR